MHQNTEDSRGNLEIASRWNFLMENPLKKFQVWLEVKNIYTSLPVTGHGLTCPTEVSGRSVELARMRRQGVQEVHVLPSAPCRSAEVFPWARI